LELLRSLDGATATTTLCSPHRAAPRPLLSADELIEALSRVLADRPSAHPFRFTAAANQKRSPIVSTNASGFSSARVNAAAHRAHH
jgi:hypothetical protein